MMRIITGKARGVRLKTLEGEATRPTGERCKEAVFSMLCFDIEGRAVLDIYAGSGQMGLEALSRGATSAVFVDSSAAAIGIIRENIAKTRLTEGAQVLLSDAHRFAQRCTNQKFDIVFIDPPYALHTAAEVALELYRAGALKPTSLIVCESEEADIFEACPQASEVFEDIKHKRFGIANITLLRIRQKETEDRE